MWRRSIWTLVRPHCWDGRQFNLIEAGTTYLWQLDRAWWFLHGSFLFLLFTFLFSWKEGKGTKLLINCFNERWNTKEKQEKYQRTDLGKKDFAWQKLPTLTNLNPLWSSMKVEFHLSVPKFGHHSEKKRIVKFSALEIATERGRTCKIFSVLDLQSGSSRSSPALDPCWTTSWLASATLVSSQPAASC